MSLAAFIRALHVAGMQPTGLEIAETLWLAQHLASPFVPPAESRPQSTMTQLDDDGTGNPAPSRAPSSAKPVPLSTTKAAIAGSRIRGHPAGIPGIPGLPRREDVQRALRPLRRYSPSLHRRVIDEDATATFIANTGLWTPVMRPAPEPLFDVVLAIDSSPSMSLWQPLIADLRAMLSRTGAFRDIRTWELTLRRQAVVLRPSGRAAARSPRQLIDGAGRRLFLIVTDGAARGWHDGSATRTLADWGKTGPVAVLQPLPEQMWPRTGLPTAPVLITAPAPGTCNSQLRVERRRRRIPGISIPVLGMEPNALRAWAQLVAGSANPVRLAVTPTSGSRQLPSSSDNLDEPDIAVQRFRAIASPQAYKLAICLSAVPLTLPIMRLVQHSVAPASPTSALAEVVLGGLIAYAGDSTYEFLPGIREVLLRELRRSELTAVFAAVSDYITQNAGRASHTFPAIAEYADGTVTTDAQAFSWVPHAVAARLGLPVMSTRAQQSTAAPPIRELGADPVTGKPMVIVEDRFGPYVTDGETRAPLRKGDNVASTTDARAAELLAELRPTVLSTGERTATARHGARIVLVGPPGAGKGTQAYFIASHLAIPRISTGDIFKYNVINNTELGAKAKEYMDRGDLVPDEVTVAMVRDRLAEDDAQEGFLLDGFPRNVPQAETLRKMLAESGTKLSAALELVVDEDEVVRRLSGRRTCKRCERVWHVLYDPPSQPGVCDDCGGELFQRDDDKEEVIMHRLEVYSSQTAPLIIFYADEQILVGIDATGSVEEITGRALAALQPSVVAGLAPVPLQAPPARSGPKGRTATASPDRVSWPPQSLVAQLTEPERAALLAAGSPVKFPDDGILVLQGDPGDGLFVLTDGMVKVTVAAESGTETMLAVRSRGDLIGEFAVLDGEPRTATARAVGAVSAIRISRARFIEFGQRYPAAQAAITRSLAVKMRAATERHAAERTWGARERVAQVLYELAEDYGERAGDGAVVIPLPITQSELGELAGVAVSTTERVLGDLRKEGIIATRYRKIAIRDMTILGAMRFS